MSGLIEANLAFNPARDHADRQAGGAEAVYINAGRGVGHYAINHKPVWVSHSAPPAGLHRFAKGAGIVGAVLALAVLIFGACDAIATGDGPGLAQDRVFFTLQDVLVNGPHALALKVFGSPDALGFFDVLASAVGFCLAVLTAEFAGIGAMVATTAAHLVHLGGL